MASNNDSLSFDVGVTGMYCSSVSNAPDCRSCLLPFGYQHVNSDVLGYTHQPLMSNTMVESFQNAICDSFVNSII